MLDDLINKELLTRDPKILVNKIFSNLTERSGGSTVATSSFSKTPGNSKTLLEFYGLVGQAIKDYEMREGRPEQLKVIYTEEEPDADSETETITYGLIKRVPGGFGQGSPFETNVKNLHPMFRESLIDADNPGYRKLITGYWHEHVVRFTCWARTNKSANLRALWFENLMDDYLWWYILQGLNRVIYMGQSSDIVITVGDNKWYGRPLDYYVKTESIKIFSEKRLEEILVDLYLGKEI